MPNQAEIEKLITEEDWGGFFDALDANKTGKLTRAEFINQMENTWDPPI